jgi:hypothetical protein
MRFREWFREWGSVGEIRGEYWIIDGSVDFADGDVGDRNHEGIAIDYVVHSYVDAIQSLAEEFDLEVELERYGEVDSEAIQQALQQITEILQERGESSPDNFLMQQLQCDIEALSILQGGGDARQYVIDHLGWIAIRSNNVELSGYNSARQREIADAVSEVLSQESGEDFDPSQVDLSIYDHATGKSWYVTLADLEQPEVVARPQQAPMTTYNANKFAGRIGDTEENKYAQPSKSKQSSWNAAAKKFGLGTELWRGTSEHRLR